MEYQKVTQEVIDKLKKIFGSDDVLITKESVANYAHDESSVMPHFPDVVVKPESAQEVVATLKLANKEKIPVIIRGAGTGLTGGAIPIYGGILVSFEKMNKILEIDKENLMITVEPGLLVMDLHSEVEKNGFLYPPDPGQKSATIGGNINTNAGGMRAVKYGVTRDFVQALEIVLPTGEIANFGGKTVKSSTGYALIDLLIGSEGTLGVTTKITLKLVPLPKISITLYVIFNNFQDAAKSVSEIIQNKIVPPAIEFVDQASILVAERYLGRPMPHNGAPAYLLVRVDGNVKEDVEASYEAVAEICMKNNAVDVLVADSKENQTKIWEGRSCIIDAAKAEGVVEVLDAVVPRNKIPDFLEGLNAICSKYGVKAQNFGHAGDGNVHTNLLKQNISDEEWKAKLPQLIDEAYSLSLFLGGNISGEHGIGLIRKRFLPLALGETQVELMRGVKKVFDPNNILNPGKIFDRE